jgi:hypothetical protein
MFEAALQIAATAVSAVAVYEFFSPAINLPALP